MTAFQAVVMAVLQGVTELFPISSLGHAVILPRLLGWPIDERAPDFLPYLVVMHLGTATALFLYFWRDWFAFLGSLRHVRARARGVDRRVFALVVLATIPAVIVGYGFRKLLGDAFGTPTLAAFLLIVNGFVLYFADQIAGKATGDARRAQLEGRVGGRRRAMLRPDPRLLALRPDHRRRRRRRPQP